MKRSKRGVGIGLTLALVAVVTTLAFALTSLSVTHSQLLTRMQQQREAENAAQSVTRLAIERILESPDFGVRPIAALTVRSGTAVGSVAFSPADSERLGIPISVNNLNGSEPVENPGGSLSPGNARIIAEGRCGGARKLLECSLNLPSFPYAVAAGGRIHCDGGITVAAVDSLSELSRLESDPSYIPGPAGVSSNCPSQGVVIRGPGLISGDVDSVGTVSVDRATRVLGSIRSPKDSLSLPEVNLQDYDPAGKPLCRNVTSVPPGLPIREQQRVQGNLVVEGDVVLSQGQLFVDGNLTVRGSVRGTGAVVATGNLRVERGTHLDASSRAALLCGGDLTLTGQGRESSYFNGLVYCKGQLRAQQLTIVGALLTGGQNVDSEQISLTDCSVVKNTSPVLISSRPGRFKLHTTLDTRLGLLVSLQGPEMKISTGQFNNTTLVDRDGYTNVTINPADLEHFSTLNATSIVNNGDISVPLQNLQGPIQINHRSAGGVKIALISGLSPDSKLEEIQLFFQQIRDIIRKKEEENAIFLFDPSRFLQWRERVKIARWRSL